MADAEQLKILIADDNDADRLILKSVIAKQGHEAITAVDGIEAVALFEKEAPQIVLLDALMPGKDGFEAAREIKQLAGDELVPIIFLTSLTDAQSLARCLDAGGDDFLSKPYNRIILKAKINAFNRMRVMHRALQDQRKIVEKQNESLVQEQEVARKVFDNVAHMGCLHANNLRYIMSPLSVFNGDVLLACQKPCGNMHVLLGDFTGHGLPAAIGAMPMAEIFYGMSNKGFSMSDVLREINQKLKQILPSSFFCCACMVDIDFFTKEAHVWVGGLPDCLLVREQGGIEKLSSRHLPLGVLSAKKFMVDIQKLELNDGDRLLIWSDGIIESRNQSGEMFGDGRLLTLIEQTQDKSQIVDRIRDEVHNFIGDGERDDDLTMVEVSMMAEDALGLQETQQKSSALIGPKDWSLRYELRQQSLKDFNPLPLLLHITMEVPGLRTHSGTLYTVMAELFVNALDHGILHLDSSLKSDPIGFAKYYQLRSERLTKLEDDWIVVRLDHQPEGNGGVMVISVEDSGDGFDVENFTKQNDLARNNGYSGRGIPLIRQVCTSVEYNAKGNGVEVVYHWQPERSA